MKCNVANWDRFLRFIIGCLLTTWAIAGGPSWSFIGLYFLITAAWGFCIVYSLTRRSTLKIPEERKKAPPVHVTQK